LVPGTNFSVISHVIDNWTVSEIHQVR